MSRRSDPTLYDDERQAEVKLPTRWEICGSCDGEGKTSRHVECDGGGFTGSEWADLDDDFKDDYLAGVYDRACDACDGTLTIIEADAYTWEPPKGMVWDVVWHDIWPTISSDNLAKMAKLHRKYARRSRWQGSWARDECQYMRRRERERDRAYSGLPRAFGR